MDLTVALNPLIPERVAYVLVGLAMLPLLMALFARARGAILRSLALAALALALLNPVIRKEDREPLPDIAVLVIDKSLSQTIGNRTKRTSDVAEKVAEGISKLPETEIRTVVVQSADA
jgi:high-affinity K+ transport system ATPase subunit B